MILNLKCIKVGFLFHEVSFSPQDFFYQVLDQGGRTSPAAILPRGPWLLNSGNDPKASDRNRELS